LHPKNLVYWCYLINKALCLCQKNVAHAGGVATVGWPVKIRLFRLFFQFSFFPNFYGFFCRFLGIPRFFLVSKFLLRFEFSSKG
jgi:hypothetical protein